jgi:aldehyde:ferredoxin oxidoreductase
MNDKERAAGRSGLGAVMGSKKIKAVVVKGKMKVPLHDEAGMKDLKKKIIKQATGGYEAFNKYGTAGFTHDSVISGDGPVKNWGGAGTSDFPSERARKISDDAVIGVEGYKPYGCWRCPIACGGRMSQKSGKFALEFNDGVGHKPEYETLALYGSSLLNDDLSSIIKVNEICNNLGLDTIAAGATIGYAIECYENGLLSKEQTDGMELTWGNAEAIVALTEKMGRREGLGDILADGVAAAWEKLGKIGTEYAVHVQGEEMPAHDPKFIPGLATTYLVSATPARHTQGGELLMPPGFDEPVPDKYTYSGHADIHSKLVAIHEVVNAAGLCMFGTLCYPIQALPEQLSVATGQDYDMEKIYEVGMRIYTMRHAFNLREGINPLTRNVPGRMIGDPPLKEGNVRDITVDYKLLLKEFLEQIGWDTATTVPGDDTLRKLDLDFLIDDLKKANVPAV